IFARVTGRFTKKHVYLYWENFKYNYGWNPGDKGPRNEFESQAVRFENWKGIRGSNKGKQEKSIELYVLSKDCGEKYNVADQHWDVVKKIEKLMEDVRFDTEFYKVNID